ncbi:MAG: hypothetical protein K9J83_00375 [Desulfarculaceae bacterium]|nr:hypothetical protein [Desulfarculaceae bacterium]
MTKCAFLVPFFGPLPDYFHFWAASCLPNCEMFHWYVYNDHISEKTVVNDAVTLVPYTYDQMISDFEERLNIRIPGHYPRRVCDYRLLFYYLRVDREPLDQFDYIGFTDMDMIYGRLARFMPEDMDEYSMISADDDRPCGPFTLINIDCLGHIKAYEDIQAVMESKEHNSFNESKTLKEIVSVSMPAFCRADPLQPAMTKKINHRHTFATWKNGKVTVYDNFGHGKEGGFYHFSRFKNEDRFKISAKDAAQSSHWVVCKFGITRRDSVWSFFKPVISLFI